jgi:hypothetical protein
VRGKTIDQRVDIWAFGCVLYEMLTGRRAFGGDDVAETLGLIVTAEPDWTKLPPTTPVSLRQLLSRCLEKDRRRRLAHISDASFDLAETAAMPLPQASVTRAGAHRWLPLASALATLAIAGTIGGVWAARRMAPTEASTVLRFEIPHPLRRPAVPAISPDGSRLAFQVSNERGFSPRWSRNGRALFYGRREQGGAALVARDTHVDPTFRAGPARHVLDLVRGRAAAFDVAPDGERFLLLKPVADPSQYAMRVVVNWFDELRGRVPITR